MGGGKGLVCIFAPPPFAQQIGSDTHFLYFFIIAFKPCDDDDDLLCSQRLLQGYKVIKRYSLFTKTVL